MDLSVMGFDRAIVDTLHELLDFTEDSNKSSHHAPSRVYVRGAKALAATPTDMKEYHDAYVFIVDMPGLKPDQIKVHVEDDNMLVVSGERRREKEKDQGVRFIKMERRLGKYLKRFLLPENADHEKILAMYQDRVLTVTVAKKPPPEPKKPKTIEVQVG